MAGRVRVERDTPMVQLVTSLRNEKYKFSEQEKEVLEKCSSRIKNHGIEAFLAGGSAVWSVTGGFNLLQRLTAALGGAAASALIASKLSVKPCIQDILALDGSPLQERLALILQKELAHNPKVRSLLEKKYYLEPLYDDYSQNMPGVVMRKRESVGLYLEKPSREVNHSGDESHLQKDERHVSLPKETAEATSKDSTEPISAKTLTSNSSGTNGSNQAQMHDESFEDMFDMLLSEQEESSRPNVGVAKKPKQKMGVLERREYNRRRYLKWQEKQGECEWGDAHVES